MSNRECSLSIITGKLNKVGCSHSMLQEYRMVVEMIFFVNDDFLNNMLIDI